MINITTDNIRSIEEQKLIDNMIKLETERKLLIVPEAKDFKVSTACVIDGEFILVSEYDMDSSYVKALEDA